MTIGAEEGTVRTYSWDGITRRVELTARPKRWYGSLGLYNPGESIEEHKGITRALVSECQRHFTSEQEALDWLNGPYHKKYLVYNSNGLAVGWYLTPERNQLTVDVWQVYVNGKKPTNLPDANNRDLEVSGTR